VISPPPSTNAVMLVKVLITSPAIVAAKDNGQDGYQAERFARDQTCKAARASLVSKGAGFKTHAVACEGSEALMVRCEFGNCRLLK
jgi:hypothetical protein